ncbi:MAG: YfhO family protein [Lachnospiraceae bacterium]|nr:YfhO family protein [Lachnospiraceae bacterium]
MKDTMRKRREGLRFWLIYTGLFLVTACLVFHYFWANDRSFVWMPDGWRQHYKGLLYYSKWLREIVSNLFVRHTLRIPTWSFSIGYGSDILTTLHYYAIGDPLNLFSVFIPEGLMLSFYELLILLRIYLAGLAFSYYCFYRGVANRRAVLAGAFAYAFCGYTLFAGTRHPYFLNPMIDLPLLLTGVERLKKERKPGLFIGSVFLSVVSNFYFFYMIVVLTVLYVAFRLFQWFRKEEWKQAAGFVAKLAVCAVAGVLAGMTILLPILLVFANSARLDTGYVYSALYNPKYYETFLMCFLSYASPGDWTRFGYGALVLIAVFSMLTRRGNAVRKAGFLVLTALFLLPFFGYAMNGFSYVSNRWCWGYSMLIAFILAAEWEELLSAARRRKLALCGMTAAYAVLCAVFCRRTNFGDKTGVTAALVIAFLSLLVLLFVPGDRGEARGKRARFACEGALLLLLFANIGVIAYREYSPEQQEYISEFKRRTWFYPNFATSESYAVRRASADETEFFRYTGRDLIPNASLRYGLSNTQFYWSLGNGLIADYIAEQALSEHLGYNYLGLDDRTMLCALAGVKYHTTTEKEAGKYVPYGYEPALNGKAVEKYVVSRNSYALPLGYTYDGWIPREEYEALDVRAKQEAMLQGVVLEEEPESFARVTPVSTAQSVPYELVWKDKQISRGEDGSFIVKKKNAALTFEFAGLPECETYLALYGLTYEGVPVEGNRYWAEEQVFTMQVSAADADGNTIEKSFKYLGESHEHYSNRHDFYINLCYSGTAKVSITLKFPTVGIYRFERMEIVCQPMELYQSAVQELGREVLTQVDTYSDNRVYASNRVTGKIQLEKPKLLVLAVPYSSGWSAYVDGEKRELLQANTMFCALELEAGAHEIELRYRTPGLAAGIALSLVGFGMWAGIVVYCRKKYGGTEKEPDTQQGLQGV